MNDRMKKAEYLFEEIGNVDDSIIAQAMSVEFQRTKSNAVTRKLIVSAAAAVLVTAVMLTTLLVGFMSGIVKKDDSAADGRDEATNEMVSKSLPYTLKRAEAKAQTHLSAEDVDLFDGNIKLIWQSESDGEIYSLNVTGNTYENMLVKALGRTYSRGEEISADDELEAVRVWISFGDGSVISPYLKKSSGNVGYGELFEYSPEIVPDDEFSKLIDDLIS